MYMQAPPDLISKPPPFPLRLFRLFHICGTHLLENIGQTARIRGVTAVWVVTIRGIHGLNFPEYDSACVAYVRLNPLFVAFVVSPCVADIASFLDFT